MMIKDYNCGQVAGFREEEWMPRTRQNPCVLQTASAADNVVFVDKEIMLGNKNWTGTGSGAKIVVLVL